MGNIFVTGISAFLKISGEIFAKNTLKTLLSKSVDGHVVFVTYQCSDYLTFVDSRFKERNQIFCLDSECDPEPNICLIDRSLSAVFPEAYSGFEKIGAALEKNDGEVIYIATDICKDMFPKSTYNLFQMNSGYDILCDRDPRTRMLSETFGAAKQWNYALKLIGSSNWETATESKFGSIDELQDELAHYSELDDCDKWFYFAALSIFGVKKNSYLQHAMYSNNEIGTIQPIKHLADVAHRHGAIFHTDAVQALGHVSIDVNELCVDMLSASAHKFNGPKGVGFLFARKGITLEPLLDGGAQEAGKRAGTENIAGIVGMSKALVKNCASLDASAIKLKKLEENLMSMLQAGGLDFIRNGGHEKMPGTISLSFKGADGEMLLHRLDLLGICVSTGSACDSVKPQISHVLKAIELEECYAKGTIRISLGKDNTEEDINAIVQALVKILK